jgi:hypothetical protein
MQKKTDKGFTKQRRFNAAAHDRQKKEFMKAQKRLIDESAAALKALETRKSEEAAAHLKQLQSEATREQRILQAALSQQQEQGFRDRQALQAALSLHEAEAGRLECQLCLVRGDKFKCFGCGHLACEICAPPLAGGPCPFCRKLIETQIEMFF